MPIRLAEVKLGSYEVTVVANSRYLFVIQYFMLLQVFFFLLTCFEFIYRPVGRGMRRVHSPPPPPPTPPQTMEVHFFSEQRFKRLKTINNVLFNCKIIIILWQLNSFFFKHSSRENGQKESKKRGHRQIFSIHRYLSSKTASRRNWKCHHLGKIFRLQTFIRTESLYWKKSTR